MFANNDIAR